MNRDEILRKAVQVHQQEPLGLTPRGISRRDRELAEASGRLLEKRLDKIPVATVAINGGANAGLLAVYAFSRR